MFSEYIEQLKDEIAKLKEERDQLKGENKTLYGMSPPQFREGRLKSA